MMKKIIETPNAPAAIGTYSQAVQVNQWVFLSGQIPLDPATMELVSEDITLQIRQVFKNLLAVVEAAGATLADIVKLNVYLCDLTHFPKVNAIMAEFFTAPFPARAAIGVAALPKNAQVEADAILWRANEVTQ
ncbi:MAG: RidA family protein [Gammaproteobacteria bacterium]